MRRWGSVCVVRPHPQKVHGWPTMDCPSSPLQLAPRAVPERSPKSSPPRVEEQSLLRPLGGELEPG